MNIVRFNRHELFNSTWMEYHRETLNQMEMFYILQNKSWFNEVYNMLCGVWDGYLYTEMLESSKQLGLPTHITDRIEITTNFINDSKK
jgi:hypothetical protein